MQLPVEIIREHPSEPEVVLIRIPIIGEFWVYRAELEKVVDKCQG